MTALKDYFTKYQELDQEVQANLPWLIRRAFPKFRLESGLVSFDEEGDLLTQQELCQLVRELMRLTGIAEQSNTRKKKGNKSNDLDASKASDDYGPCSENEQLARLLAIDPQSTR